MPNDLPIVLHKNGTATLELDKRITLRMPKVGEFETLRLSQHDLGELIVDLTDGANVRSRQIDRAVVELGGRDTTKPRAEQGDVNEYDLDDDVRGQLRELRREQRSLRATLARDIERARLEWVLSAIAMLRIDHAAAVSLELDELPQWLASDSFAVAIITHWQTAPLAHGGG